MRRYLISAALIALMSACAQAEARPEPVSEPTATVQVPAKPTDSGAGKSGGAAIIYGRSGGIAGISEMWMIFPDGRVVSADGKVFAVPAVEVSALLAEIEDLGFFEISNPSGLPGTCADCFVHQITVNNGERLNSITVQGRISDPEDPRLKILEIISELLSSLPEEAGY